MKLLCRLLCHATGIFALMYSNFATASNAIDEVYEPYDKLLDKYLIEHTLEGGGLVSAFQYWQAMKDSKTFELIEAQKKRLTDFDTTSLQNRERAVAFWLNAYNFFMISYIIENPKKNGEIIDSVKDYGSLLKPYKVFEQAVFDIGGEKYSLNEIEKAILLGQDYQRRGWKDARIHFAVNCASVGCPPLRRAIYEPATLEALLTENTRRALKTSRHLRFDNDVLYVSKVFDWYESDYVQAAGSVRDFLVEYTDPQLHERIKQAREIRYIDYDWSLNRPHNFAELKEHSRLSAADHTNKDALPN